MEDALAKEIDSVARGVITGKGYGGHFTQDRAWLRPLHARGTLHSPQSETELRNGTVLTIEPGVRLEGGFGIRIEGDVVIMSGRGPPGLRGR